MPPLECANFLECENKTVCVAPFDLPHGSNTSFFHHIPENYHNSPCWAFFFGQYGLECDSMWNYRRLTRKLHLRHIPENVIPGDFSQKKRTKKKNGKKEKITEYEDFMECEDLAECVDFTVQYVYVPSCGARCPRWSAKNLWNAKNSEYAWLV